MLTFKKSAKSDFLHNFFSQELWNLKITENMCHHTVVTPPHFCKNNLLYNKLKMEK